jgi:hypothetical protein
VSRTTLVIACIATVVACGPAGAQDWRTLDSSRPAAGETELAVDLAYGAGSLHVGPGDPATLYHATLRYDAGRVDPLEDYRNGRLRIGIESHRGWRGGGSTEAGELDLTLSPTVALDLKLQFGAARADLELGGLRVRSAEVSTGASETNLRFSELIRERMRRLDINAGAAAFRAHQLGHANAERIVVSGGVGDIALDFTGAWQGDTSAEISVGIGSLTLTLPRDVGVRVTRKSVLSSFTAPGLAERDGAFFSDNWDAAEHRLQLDVSSALGSVEIRWVDAVEE